MTFETNDHSLDSCSSGLRTTRFEKGATPIRQSWRFRTRTDKRSQFGGGSNVLNLARS